MSDYEILSLINRRERQLLVHSYIYYELDDSIISDSQWSEWGVELVDLRETYPDIYDKSVYSEAFRTFDASTGFDLIGWYTRPEIVSKAHYILRIERKSKNGTSY